MFFSSKVSDELVTSRGYLMSSTARDFSSFLNQRKKD